jgi:hypothetical protein
VVENEAKRGARAQLSRFNEAKFINDGGGRR